MNNTEIASKYKERIKKQNEKIKQQYDRVNAILPNGTKERIHAQGYSINSFINAVVLAELDRLEKNKSASSQVIEQSQFQHQKPVDSQEEIEEFNNWLHKIQAENEQRRLAEAQARQIRVQIDNN